MKRTEIGRYDGGEWMLRLWMVLLREFGWFYQGETEQRASPTGRPVFVEALRR